ncbi:MAG: hypothetical protein V4560_00245 [Bacteroidota bacterium]
MKPEQLELLIKQRISIPANVKCEEYPAKRLFEFLGKNNGLTEEFIYNVENPLTVQLPVYTASYEPIGYIPIDAAINGKPLKKCIGETIIIFRQGYAGLMYIPKEEMFFASEHTIPIQVKKEFKEELNQHWFAKYYQPEVMHYVTGKADSGNFSKLAFEKMNFLIPERKWQDKCAKMYIELETELNKVRENISGLSLTKIEKKDNGSSDEELVEKYESGRIDLGKTLNPVLKK